MNTEVAATADPSVSRQTLTTRVKSVIGTPTQLSSSTSRHTPFSRIIHK